MSTALRRAAAVLVGVLAFAAAAAAPRAAAAQDPASEYALVVEGSTVMSLTLHEARDGQLAGSVSVAGKTLSVTGSPSPPRRRAARWGGGRGSSTATSWS